MQRQLLVNRDALHLGGFHLANFKPSALFYYSKAKWCRLFQEIHNSAIHFREHTIHNNTQHYVQYL